MNKKEIVKKLREIQEIDKLSNEELMKRYKFLKEEDLQGGSKYACISGIVHAEIEYLADRIEGGDRFGY